MPRPSAGIEQPSWPAAPISNAGIDGTRLRFRDRVTRSAMWDADDGAGGCDKPLLGRRLPFCFNIDLELLNHSGVLYLKI